MINTCLQGRPRIPKESSEFFTMPAKYKMTADGGDFLRKIDYMDGSEEKVFLVYMSDAGQHLLSTYGNWSGDGTFSTAPKGFSQVCLIFFSDYFFVTLLIPKLMQSNSL